MNKKHLLAIIGVSISLVVIGVSLWYAQRTLATPIRTIIVTSPFPLLFDSARIASTSLLLLDVEALRSHILQKNHDVSTVIIEKSYPQTVVMTVIARTPIARILVGERVRAIDEDGVLLTYISEPLDMFPVVDAHSIPFYAGQKADWRISAMVTYLKLFQLEHISLKQATIDASSSQYRFLLADSITAIIPFSDNPGAVVASLQVILGRFRIEGKQVHIVDFRFDKPIITFQTGEKISS